MRLSTGMSGLSGRGGRLLVVVLLLLATAAFGTGVAIEKSRLEFRICE